MPDKLTDLANTILRSLRDTDGVTDVLGPNDLGARKVGLVVTKYDPASEQFDTIAIVLEAAE